MTSIYLAHSIFERTMGNELQVILEGMGYEVNNPFYPKNEPRPDIAAIDEGKAAAWKLTDGDKPTSEAIIEADLTAVKNSDIFLAIYPDGLTVGIPCEHLYAWLNVKIIYALVPAKLKGHPWIIGLSSKVFTDRNELLHAMMTLAKKGRKSPYDKREYTIAARMRELNTRSHGGRFGGVVKGP